MATAKPKAESPNGRVAVGQPRPFKVICQPVFCIRDDKGEITQEIAPGSPEGPLQFILYVPDFDSLREKVEEMIPQLQQALSQQTQEAQQGA